MLSEPKKGSDHEVSKRASENGFDKLFHDSGIIVYDVFPAEGPQYPPRPPPTHLILFKKLLTKPEYSYKFVSIASNHTYNEKSSEVLNVRRLRI